MKKLTTLMLLPLLLVGCSGTSLVDREADTAAIQELIHRETQAYYEKDLSAWQDCFIHEPYLRHWSYYEGYANRIRHYDSWEDLLDRKESRFEGDVPGEWNHEALQLNDLDIQFRGDVAWATFRQVDHDPASGTVLGEALATQILERLEGQWKIAYANYLFFPRIGGI